MDVNFSELMWSYTILCDTNDFSCKFSTNNSFLMLNPLSTALLPRESTKMMVHSFQNTLYFGILQRKLERKTSTASDNSSKLANFSLCLGHSLSMNSSNCCLVLSASSAVNHLSLQQDLETSFLLILFLPPLNLEITQRNFLQCYI